MTILSKNIIPQGNTFFLEKLPQGIELPSPQEVRTHHDKLSVHVSTVVRFQHLKLVVKYGQSIRASEGQTLWALNRFTSVVAPTVYGWFQDGPEMFIYMSLIDGVTLSSRWSQLSVEQKNHIASQLRHMLASLANLRLPHDELYIGSLGHTPCRNYLFDVYAGREQGPFSSVKGFHDFLTSLGAEFFHPNGVQSIRNGLSDTFPIVFTHNDLNFGNILISEQGSQVMAIIDWELSGFYPAYWEWAMLTRMEGGRSSDVVQFVDKVLKPHREIYGCWDRWLSLLGI